MSYRLNFDGRRYSFSVLVAGKDVFDSQSHYYLSQAVSPTYKYAWEACRDARKLERGASFHVEALSDLEQPIRSDISAEEMLLDHYRKILKNLHIKVDGVDSDKEKDKIQGEGSIVYGELKNLLNSIEDKDEKKEIKKMISKLKKIIGKVGGIKEQPQEAFSRSKSKYKFGSKKPDRSMREEVLEDYAESICSALQEKHNSCVYEIVDSDKEQSDIIILNKCAAKEDELIDYEPILSVIVNEKLNVENILPLNGLNKSVPYHSVEFFQSYWKPCVDAVGHIYIEDLDSLILADNVNLPDFCESISEAIPIEAWDMSNKEKKNLEISFRGQTKPTWIFDICKMERCAATKAVKYTEEEFFNAKDVVCIDPSLESIYGRIGQKVGEIIPHEDFAEIQVDFGRGLGVVRLADNQIEIVN